MVPFFLVVISYGTQCPQVTAHKFHPRKPPHPFRAFLVKQSASGSRSTQSGIENEFYSLSLSLYYINIYSIKNPTNIFTISEPLDPADMMGRMCKVY